MFNTSDCSVPLVASLDNNSNNGWGGDGAWLIWIILIFALFGWNNNGWGGNGNNGGYVATAATQADIQRGFDNQAVIGKLDGITNGLCDGFYAQNSAIMSGTNTLQNAIQQAATANLQNTYAVQQAINADTIANMQNTNALQSQLAQCCCDNRYEALQNANTTQNLLTNGFATVGYNMATDTCAITTAIQQQTQDIMQNCNANYRALHDELVQSQLEAKNEKIAEQAQQIQNLNLAASQAAQNTYLINALKPAPVPAFSASALYGAYANGCTGCSGAGTIGF